MKKSKKHSIKLERLSKHDQKLINEHFTWLEREDKKHIAHKFNITVSYLNMIIAGTRYRKDIFNAALGIALKKKKAHQKSILELQEA